MTKKLSPHLFIYKPQISSLFSVFHRATGIFLTLGLFFFILMVEVFAYNISHFFIYQCAFFFDTFLSWIIIAAFIFLLFSFYYHIFNGIRHLFWDFLSKNTLQIDFIQKSAFIISCLTLFVGSFILFLLS